MLDLLGTLRELVAIPSVNPMASGSISNDLGEARLTDYLEGIFRQLRVRYQRQVAEPGRENIIASFDGAAGPKSGKLLLWNAHQDTVPATGMTIPPFAATINSGRLYGRGACDVKGGMAAMLVALSRLAEERPAGMPTIALACTVNEECGFTGAEAVTKLWDYGGGIIPRKPDAAIVAEPTCLNVVVAHKGLIRWRCHTHGRAAHSAYPERGDNAVYKMAKVLSAVERYQNDIVRKLASHPLCGEGTVNVGTIGGGVSVNTVPDRCTVEIDRRLAPEENPEKARQHLIDYLEQETRLGSQLEHDPPFMRGSPLSDEANGELADQVIDAARAMSVESRKIGVPYATDGASFAAAGVPTVIVGPGSIEQAHTADEWIAIDQLERAAEFYYRLALKLGGTSAS